MSGDHRHDRSARVVAAGLVAIVRATTAADGERLGEQLLGADVDVIEVSLTTPGALGVVERLADRYPAALIGAGTVLDAPSARAALLAGARFVVSPGLSRDVLTVAHRYGAPVLAGAMTPTEIDAALAAGADLVKLFPARQLGPGYLRAVRAALPQAPVVPTGGIDAGNAAAWLDAGAVALGVGSAVTSDPEQLARLRAEIASRT